MIEAPVTSLTSSQLEWARRFGRHVNKLGVNFFVYDLDGQIVLSCQGGKFDSDEQQLTEIVRALPAEVGPEVRAMGDGGNVLVAGLKTGEESVAVGLIDLPATGDNGQLHRFCTQNKLDFAVLKDLCHKGRQDGEYLREMLSVLAEEFQHTAAVEGQIEIISSELAQTYEELVLLYKMSSHMKVTESDCNYLQMACDSLTDLVNVEGIAILLEKIIEGEKRLVLTAGSGLIEMDERNSGILFSRLTTELNKSKEALLDSEVDSAFKYDWPKRIKNIIAVPLHGNEKIIGMMVATNRLDKPDFDSTDVKLFTSVANECAVFIENGRLFKELEELLIGSLRALTSSIDAKDEYTRGHSERVAFISRWIAERLAEKEGLEVEQVHKIYLAGLLHDVGKIGVDESVLRKPGTLNDDEFKQIKDHPSISAAILSGIKQMADIVPGILSHHERPDGKGYPRGLTEKQIPLAGKIVMLADAFDAMTSKRTYRGALTIEQALAEIEKSLGSQFDEKVGRIFLSSDIYQLWNIIQDGMIESYYFGDFAGCGTAAVEALIR